MTKHEFASDASVGKIIIISLLVIHLLPVWVFTYFPTQDGASHIYNAYVLKEYHKHENYRLREVYELNLTLFPNWTSHTFLALLMYVFPPIICEKILISICIGLLPLSLFYFLKSVQKGKTIFALVGFIFAYNYLLHMGFYNFVLSMSLFFFTLGYWWKRRNELTIANIGILYALLIATYLTHYQSYATLMMALTFFSVFLSLYEALRVTWGYKGISGENEKTLASKLKTFAAKLKPPFLFLVTLLPAYFIMISYILDRPRRGSGHRGFEWLNEYFFSMKSLVSFRDEHILIGRVLLAVSLPHSSSANAHRQSPTSLQIPQIIEIGGCKRTTMDQNCEKNGSVSAVGDYLDGNVFQISLDRIRWRLDKRQDPSLHISDASSLFQHQSS